MNEFFDYIKYKNNTAVIDSHEGFFSYNDLLVNSQTIKNKLNKGLAFCFCKNSIGSLIGYLAFLEKGVVPVMLESDKDDALVKSLLQIYTPNYLWLPNDLISKYAFDSEVIYELFGYSLIYYNRSQLEISSDLSLLLPTSGSTGSPKLVRLSRKNILSNAESIAEYLNITSDERPITSLPMYYSYGISVINSHLLKGATLLLTNYSVMQKEFWGFAKEYDVTSISGVPYTYEMLRRLRVFQMELPNLRTFTQAGGKLNANIAKEYIEKAHEHGKQFIVMYGQTEATARMSYLPFEKALEKYSSIGIAIPGGKFKLIDENCIEITDHDIDGELVYSGVNVSLGYAECLADLSKGDENNGLLYTGDIARRDNEGFYYITGRKKRFLKVYGNRVNLDGIEQILKSLSIDCACVGVDDKITIFTNDIEKEHEIKSYLTLKTGLNSRAFSVKYIDPIPKNSSGKIQYAELSKLL